MTRNKQLGVVISLVALSTLTPTSSHAYRHYYNDEPTVGEALAGTALVVGGITAAGFGLAALGNWLFGPSDEALIDKAERTKIDAMRRYGAVMHTIEQEHSRAQAPVNDYVSDRFLTELSPDIGEVSGWLADMRRMRDSLQSQTKTLRKRGRKCESRTMLELSRQLEDIESQLRGVHHFIKHHEGFFHLYTIHNKLLGRYQRELQAHTSDGYALERELRLAVTGYGCQVRSSYPYLAYVDRIENDQRQLESAIASTVYAYDLVRSARSLSLQLRTIGNSVVASSEYAQDRNNRERDRLEREHLELERQRLALAWNYWTRPTQVVVVEKPRPAPVIVVEHPRPEPVVVVHERPRPDVVVVHEQPRPDVIVVQQEQPRPSASVDVKVHYDSHSNSCDYDAEVGFEA